MTTYTNEEWFHIYNNSSEEEFDYDVESQKINYSERCDRNLGEKDFGVYGVERYREIFSNRLKKSYELGQYKIGK